MTNQENGATLLYHGQRVWSEWQSKQPRRNIPSIWGGTDIIASSVREGITVGFVRAGRIA
ncbi:MAG TPA: hypothetical protein VFB23_10865 [Candidatus Acidoferrales bacterium]|jgi:hypothetical protein|nr:hypothetical protein [Candidatus Acidoferrales bacterium]